MPLRPDSENRKREKRMQEIGSKKSEAKKHGAPASVGEGGAGKKLAADPAKRIAAKDEEIPVRVYFRPGANMPGRREVLSWSQQAESVRFGRHAPKTRPWKAVAVRRGDGGARTEKPEQADRTGGSAPARSPFPSAASPASRGGKRRNSHHRAVFGRAGKVTTAGSSELVEEGGFEPPKPKQQIYSLPHLTALELLRMKLELVDGLEPPAC